MKKMSLITLMLFSLIAFNQCIDTKILNEMRAGFSSFSTGYPSNFGAYINGISGNGEVKQGEIEKKNLVNMASWYGLPQEVAKKFQGMQFAPDMKMELIMQGIVVNQAYFHQYVGAAYSENGMVKWAIICGKALGNIVQQFTYYDEKVCKGWWIFKKCHNEKRSKPRGTNPSELNIIQQTLQARAFEEIRATMQRNNVNAGLLDLSDTESINQMLLNNEPIFINDATLKYYGVLGKGQAPYQLQFTPQHELVLFDINYKPIWNSNNYYNDLQLMLIQNHRLYNTDNDRFLLLTPSGHLGVYTEHINDNGNYQTIWQSTHESESETHGPYTLIIDESNKMMIVDANYEIVWEKSNEDDIPFEFGNEQTTNLLDE